MKTTTFEPSSHSRIQAKYELVSLCVQNMWHIVREQLGQQIERHRRIDTQVDRRTYRDIIVKTEGNYLRSCLRKSITFRLFSKSL